MANENGNGRWQLAFWITTVLCLGAYGAYGYTNTVCEKLVVSIVSNDRLREQEDKAIEQRVISRIEPKIDAMQKDITDIKISLARLRK